MHSFKVNLKKNSYKIIAGSDIICKLGRYLSGLNIGSDAYIITNPCVKKMYGKVISKALKTSGFSVRFKTIPDTEKSKSINKASSIIADLAGFDKKKRIFIVALGGGVIGDLAGFVASIYKRGIPYIQVPTTLLAQVDSSIGGKTAVDLSEGKNLVGAFYQPRLVFSDTRLLRTLDIRQLRSGFAEVIKYGIIKDPKLFTYLEKNHKRVLNKESRPLEYIVGACSKIKAGIVSLDEKEEKGIRTILNFGHTVGHAIEAASSYRAYNHGEAVALGILAASRISKCLNLINCPTYKRIENLIRISGLPTKISGIQPKKIINAHYHDKKFIGKKNRLVLIKGIGKTKILENIPLEIISGAITERPS